MKRSAFRSWGWIVFYSALIGSLSLWLGVERRRNFDDLTISTLNQTLELTNLSLAASNEELTRDLRKSTDAYPNPFNQALIHKVKTAVQLAENAQGWKDFRSISLFSDSLLALTMGDTSLAAGLDRVQSYAEDVSFRSTAGLYYAHLLPLLIDLQLHEFLLYQQAIYRTARPDANSLIPRISFPEDSPKAGEAFEGSLFLSPYSQNVPKLQVWVNGDSLPVQDYRARFSQQWNEPGTKHLHIRISYHPSGWQVPEISEKDVEVRVQKPCAQ